MIRKARVTFHSLLSSVSKSTRCAKRTPINETTPILADDTMEEEEEEGAYGFRKVKMFEMAPFGDPQLEERRQRAIYAKKNRDMKKR